MLARELQGSPALLVAENPTRGLDLRATAAIHARLRAARDAGMAVIVYSSDLDELLVLADRTYGMFSGTLIAAARDRQSITRRRGAVGAAARTRASRLRRRFRPRRGVGPLTSLTLVARPDASEEGAKRTSRILK